jgi:putative polyketide hydroxylase
MESDAIVIGAGPAGLTAAITLAQAGARCLLVERRIAPLPVPRATLVSLRSMELMRSWGLEPAIRAGGDEVMFQMALTPTLAELDQHVSVAVGVPSVEQASVLSPTTPACVPQDHLEAVLLDHARRLPAVTVTSGVDAALEDCDGTGVRVRLRDVASGASRVARARFLIGADGAHGTTRRALGIGTVSSGPLDESIAVVIRAPLWELVGRHRYLLYALDGSRANGTFLPAGDGNRWVYGFEWDPSGECLDQYTDQRIVDIVRAAAGTSRLAVTVERVGAFQFIAEIADRFRSGSVFLVGDAAHRVTPRGGTGMNTAIASAHNLAWKLAWVINGWAGPELLDTYETERRPIVEHNITRSIDPAGSRRQPRDEVHTDLAGRIAHHWTACGDGHRVSTLDLIDRRALTLLTCTDDLAWRAACATINPRVPIIVRALDANCAIRLGIGRHGATLVRPDAIPIWLTTESSDAADRLERTVRAYLRRPADADALPEHHVRAGPASLARPA